MSAAVQRTLIRIGSLLGALIVATGIIVMVPNLDPRLSGPILGLAITAALGLEKFLSESSDTLAAPTVRAVSTALVDQATLAGTFPAAVAPPSQPTPPKPLDTLPPQA